MKWKSGLFIESSDKNTLNWQISAVFPYFVLSSVGAQVQQESDEWLEKEKNKKAAHFCSAINK